MSSNQPLIVNPFQEETMSQILARPPLLSSYESGWNGIHLAHYYQLSGEIPEHYISQHIISISARNPEVLEVISDEKSWITSSELKDNLIQVYPADRSYQVGWIGESEFIHCYIDPQKLSEIAYESVAPDCLELMVHFMRYDPLIYQIVLALKTELEANPSNSRFYAESASTFLAAHLVKHYTTKQLVFQEYTGGLSSLKLRRAIDYIQAHLAEDLSLDAIATEIGMSRFYFCRLFKQSTGITPYQYLIKCRIDRAKVLLRQGKLGITDIAVEVGFSNQSHFTKHFKRLVGVTPKKFIDY
ncbi:MAG: AraC family transcriptional regulator [Pleurocapsa sp. MO_226.B13]|nr:AraC family transcriptional regulator [Pleurocapsa sp. MO_226.B13]